MQVVVNGSNSSWMKVLSGELQSSVLGPLLFLLFANDLPDWIKTDICIFTDDTKIWTRITAIKDSENLQRDLDSRDHWSEKWLLHLNPEKCKIMHIRHSHKTPYTITQHEKVWTVQETTEEKDLGGICTADWKVSWQCCKAASKANRILGMVSRQFKNCFLILYKGFVTPHLEYAIQAWSPYLRGNIDRLKKVRQRATRLISGYKYCPMEKGNVDWVWQHLNKEGWEMIRQKPTKLWRVNSKLSAVANSLHHMQGTTTQEVTVINWLPQDVTYIDEGFRDVKRSSKIRTSN